MAAVDPLRVAGYTLWPLLTAFAWLVARKQRSHRWVAAYFTWMAAADWLRLGCRHVLDAAPRPFSGLGRVALHCDDLVVLSWYFLFLACCLHYFARRTPWAAIGAWVVTWAITLNYPLVSGDVISWIFRLASLGCLMGSWLCIAWGLLRAAKVGPGLAHLVLILFASGDVVINLVPYSRGYFSHWPLVRLVNVLVLVACIAAHVVWLRGRGLVAERA